MVFSAWSSGKVLLCYNKILFDCSKFNYTTTKRCLRVWITAGLLIQADSCAKESEMEPVVL